MIPYEDVWLCVSDTTVLFLLTTLPTCLERSILTLTSADKKWGQAEPHIPTSFPKKTLVISFPLKKPKSSQDARTNISTLYVFSMFQLPENTEKSQLCNNLIVELSDKNSNKDQRDEIIFQKVSMSSWKEEASSVLWCYIRTSFGRTNILNDYLVKLQVREQNNFLYWSTLAFR